MRHEANRLHLDCRTLRTFVGDCGQQLFVENDATAVDHPNWQSITNDYICDDPNPGATCHRYQKIQRSLAGPRHDPISAMELLSAVSQASTQWSAVYDLAEKQVSLVMDRHYRDKPLKFDLQELANRRTETD